MHSAAIDLEPVQSPAQQSLARGLVLEYLEWVAAIARTNYGLSFDIAAMLASDIDDVAKFYPPTGRFYLVRYQGQAVGVGCLKTLARGIGEIQRMYVRPPVRGAGAGRTLVQRLIADARQMGLYTIRLESLKALQAAHALYRSVGFADIDPYSENSMKTYQPVETIEAYGRSAVFMELNLDRLT